MKKFLALLLCAMMLLTMTAAFAEDAVTTTGTFTKKWEGAVPVGETLTFNTEFVVNQTTNSTDAPETAILPATIELELTADEDGVFDVPFTVTAPAEYGTYVYRITEDSATAPIANVTYDTDALYVGVLYTADGLTVTLINEPDGVVTVENRAVDTNNDTKKDQFVNEYVVGSFEVTKEITGNAANEDDRFVVEVSFTSEAALDNLAMTWTSSADTATVNDCTVTALEANTAATMQITIGHEETITFANVPVGVLVSVEELKQDGKEDLNFYTPSYEGNDITVTEDSQTIAITNTKATEIPTGIELDSIPYIVLLAVAALGVVGFLVKRRMAAADDD